MVMMVPDTKLKSLYFLYRSKTVIWKKEKLVEPLTKMSYKEERMG